MIVGLESYRLARAAAALAPPPWLGDTWSRCWTLLWECVAEASS